jgi:hypothetical protein
VRFSENSQISKVDVYILLAMNACGPTFPALSLMRGNDHHLPAIRMLEPQVPSRFFWGNAGREMNQ